MMMVPPGAILWLMESHLHAPNPLPRRLKPTVIAWPGQSIAQASVRYRGRYRRRRRGRGLTAATVKFRYLDCSDTFAGHTYALGRCAGQIDAASAYKRAAIVDSDDYRTPGGKVGDFNVRAKGQGPRCGGQISRVEDLAAGGAIAVEAGSVPGRSNNV